MVKGSKKISKLILTAGLTTAILVPTVASAAGATPSQVFKEFDSFRYNFTLDLRNSTERQITGLNNKAKDLNKDYQLIEERANNQIKELEKARSSEVTKLTNRLKNAQAAKDHTSVQKYTFEIELTNSKYETKRKDILLNKITNQKPVEIEREKVKEKINFYRSNESEKTELISRVYKIFEPLKPKK
ncbi:hypothetical protein [Niallia sp. MER 6]|uniref:hypothetical protein n=1 Tax=Niallia sp. MER 6 TaxID=2939567 RepID=UPI00203D1276|nr:hypothetical protein [Niallia sp. MER 6]MCM3032547.1 hypothetical protein [Niallia sp. MER 6]